MRHINLVTFTSVVALMAFGGTASATTITSSSGATPSLAATSTNSKLDGSFVTVECSHSTIAGNIESHGAGVTAKANLTTLTFSGCNYQLTVEQQGALEFHGSTPTGNGTITWSGAKVTLHTSVGACTFTTASTHVGTLTGSNLTGGLATWHINSAKIPRTGGNFLCGSAWTWTGNYTFGSPSTLEVH